MYGPEGQAMSPEREMQSVPENGATGFGAQMSPSEHEFVGNVGAAHTRAAVSQRNAGTFGD